jgi:hypothetical protein
LCTNININTNIACSQAADQLDEHGWPALHHAVDATSYSWRAMEAAKALLKITPREVLNSRTIGSQPSGYTCFHFASEGSDKSFARADLVRALVEQKAELEERRAIGNTAFLLACGTGATDIIKALADSRADVNACNDRRVGGFQRAQNSSSSSRRALEGHGLARPKEWAASGRQWTGESESRLTRHLLRCDLRGDEWDWRGDGWDWRDDCHFRGWNQKRDRDSLPHR